MKNCLRVQLAIVLAIGCAAATEAQDARTGGVTHAAAHHGAPPLHAGPPIHSAPISNLPLHNTANNVVSTNTHAGPCGACCPRCHAYCTLTRVPGVVEKSCWEIECEEICIPAITFPWEKCNEPKYGTVITVKRLKKVTYECPTCLCEWTPVCTSCGSCGGAPVPPFAPPPAGGSLPPAGGPGNGPPVPPAVDGAAFRQLPPVARPVGHRH